MPDTLTSHSLTTPLAIAATLLTVLMVPKVLLSSSAATPFLAQSATSQLSKALNSRLVATPPSTRPPNSAGTSSASFQRPPSGSTTAVSAQLAT